MDEQRIDTDGDSKSTFVQPKKTMKRKRLPDSRKMEVDLAKRPKTQPRSATDPEIRKVPVPPHRYTPLKDNWIKIFTPIVQYLNLQVRFNLKSRNVEIRRSDLSQDIASLQKAADFVKAFVLGFDVDDALALVRLDDLFVESFEVTDVKPLRGEHLSRAIGRLAGKNGRTKYTIENTTKTRIVLADRYRTTENMLRSGFIKDYNLRKNSESRVRYTCNAELEVPDQPKDPVLMQMFAPKQIHEGSSSDTNGLISKKRFNIFDDLKWSDDSSDEATKAVTVNLKKRKRQMKDNVSDDNLQIADHVDITRSWETDKQVATYQTPRKKRAKLRQAFAADQVDFGF